MKKYYLDYSTKMFFLAIFNKKDMKSNEHTSIYRLPIVFCGTLII